MACCGFSERVRLGAIYQSATGRGKRWQGDFIAGVKVDFGNGFYNPCNQLADALSSARLGGALRLGQCHPCSPTCGRGKKGELDADSELSAIELVQEREACLSLT